MAEEHYTLEGLDIISVGLVSRAAVSLEDDEDGPTGENFIILKNKEGLMPDEVTIEEVATPDEQPESTGDVENPETVETDQEAGQGEPEGRAPDEGVEKGLSLLERAVALFKAKTTKADPAAIKEAVRVLRAGDYTVTEAQLADFLGGDEDDEMEMGNKTKTQKSKTKEVENMPETTVVNQTGPDVEAILKAVEERIKVKEEAMAKEVELAKAEAQRANERADKADEEKQRLNWLEKAAEFRTLPVSRTELGDKLHNIAKSLEQEDLEWLVNVLKASDTALGAAGIFATLGTTESPAQLEVKEKVVKTAKEQGVSYKDALLDLPAHEQAQLVDQILKGGK